jgi:cbb3-type cytochrome oxidase maturation protein
MDIMLYMIPVALLTGLLWLFAFLWSMKNGQLDDLDGASHRALFAEDDQIRTAKPSQEK